jgi:glycosyltransferase involved in cell wall biosynthesis
MRHLRIAILGARGIPGRYGGFETFAAELAPRLSGRGHHVTVYCQTRYSLPERPEMYRGVHLEYVNAGVPRHFETPVHELRSLLHALRQKNDILYVLGFRSSILYVLPKLLGHRIIMNTDGLDWKRSKWNWFGRKYLKVSEAIGVKLASCGLIADSQGMQEYIRESYGAESKFIPYGAPVVSSTRQELLTPYGLTPQSYFLVVARIEPENNLHLIVSAFEQVQTGKKLVIVGGANYRSRYFARLRTAKDPRILFLGPIYEPDCLNELWCNSYAYIHGHEVGGTNPALLQAMGCGCCVLVRDTNFNREVIADAGLAWRPSPPDLARQIDYVLQHPEDLPALRQRAVERIRTVYNWERTASSHETYFLEAARPGECGKSG